MDKRIFLIGDSIVDNYFHLDNKNKDLTEELKVKGYKVNNYAVDGMRLNNIREGLKPNVKYIKSRKYPYELDESGKLNPLKLLSENSEICSPFISVYEKINKKRTNSMVLLSVGGHNFDDNKNNIILGENYFYNSVVNDNFVKEYNNVIENIKTHTNRILLISIYPPYMGSSGKYRLFKSVAMSLVARWKNFLMEIGKKYDVPILDLGQMVDINNVNHYRNDIYLSDDINKCIANCVDYIFNNYEGYKIYYAENCDSNKIRCYE